ncbi:MAG: S8 family serine peptidase [Nocardioidaceae bacterium]
MQRRTRLFQLLSLTSAAALTVAGLAATAGPSSADPGGDKHGLSLAAQQPHLVGSVDGDKAASSALAKTPASLRNLSSAKRIPVMIKYDYDGAASYAGGISGFKATSPSVTDKRLKTSRPATSRYLGYVRGQERSITRSARAAVPGLRVTGNFRIVYGGVSATVPGNRIKDLLRVPGVVAVQPDSLNKVLTDSSIDFIHAPAAYSALRTRANAGKGLLLGNLDTGVWPEHPSFADKGNLPAYSGPALPCQFGDNPLTPANDPFTCNNKLVGGRAFLATYDAINGTTYMYPDLARDGEGHGSHTASTSAGNIVDNVQTVGPTIARINGVAPGAQVMEYRVCSVQGCYSSDSAAAVQQAILDGVDVINFSISGGNDPTTDPVELSFLDAYAAGVFVAASAGNAGPGAGTANHGGPWVTTVAASTQTREFFSHLTLTADNGDTYEVDGASLTHGAGPLPVVSAAAPPYNNALCTSAASPGIFAGKIVVCQRGGNGRVEKGFNVSQGGAQGMILFNPALADVETDNHWLPTVHVADGTDLVAFLGSHTGITGQFTDGAARAGQGDVMAAFSSRGPLGSVIKPDITAPGVQILAAMTPTPGEVVDGPPGQYYQAIAGTSMSSPHIAGVALLLKALHPAWTPGQIKSAMMTQAVTSVVKEDLTTPADPFDFGAGRVDVARAMRAPVTISETASNFAALTGDPIHSIDMNLPSIDAPVMPGRITTTRTLKNVTSGTLYVTARSTTGPGTSISFSPRTFSIAPGGSRTVSITISSEATVDVQQFAAVRFDTNRGSARLPVAFIPRQGSVGLDQTCSAPSVARGTTATCTVTATNNSFDSQSVTSKTSVSSRLRITGASGATVSNGVASASGTLGPAQLGVPSVDPGGLFGYIPLDAFGTSPTPIGDEQMLNFNVPEFVFNGVKSSAVGIDSNGYLVVGGGTSADNNCCNLPSGADPAPPNNVLAPFWTDLDGTGTTGILVNVLTDGVSSWLVVEWRVNVFGTSDTRTFQTWIGVNGVQDISFAYASPPASPFGQPFLVGAENANGEGDMEAVLPSTDLTVTSTDPAPGDSLTYTVTVRGLQVGQARVHSEMTADGVAGVTVVNTPLPVTSP